MKDASKNDYFKHHTTLAYDRAICLLSNNYEIGNISENFHTDKILKEQFNKETNDKEILKWFEKYD